MSLKRGWRLLISDERGQSTTEYILIMAVVVMVAMKFRGMFEKQVGGMLQRLDSDLQRGMGGGGDSYN